MAVIIGTGDNNDIAGSADNDTLSGGAGNDTLTGHAGDDLLQGEAGDDVLVGGAGADTLDGGTGSDQVLYYRETGTQGVQVNLQTGTAIDTFGHLDRLISIEQVYGSNLADTLTGAAASGDFLFGQNGADLIQGLGGNDTLVGGEGADTLDGGAGIDQVAYFLETGTRGVQVNLQTGTAVDSFGTIDRLISIEQVYGSNLADTLTGAAASGDFLFGRGGADLIAGLGGDDTLVGGEGADTLDGGAGIDQVAYFLETGTQGVQVNLQNGTAIDTFGTMDRLISIEQVYGSNLADTLTGAAATADFLFGRGGADLIAGLGGDDTLVGGEGTDTLDGGAGIDQVAYFLETGTQGVQVDLQAGTATDTFGTTDSLISVERVHGSDYADTLSGSSTGDLFFGRGGADLILGLGGDDTLVGGEGADTLNGGAGFDQVAYFLETGTQGVRVDLRAGSATDTFGNTDQLIGIEYVHGSNGNDTLLGSDGNDDRLFGRDGDDYIDGRDGSDLIYTGNGNDRVVVGGTLTGARDTVVINGTGTKVITGTNALGTLYGHHLVFDLPEAVVVNLSTGIARSANMTLDFTLALYFLEVGGTAFDDVLIGGNSNFDYLEWFSGNQGNDTIDGGGGTGNTVIYDDEVRFGSFNHITQQQEYGTHGVVVNLMTGVATDTFGFTDTLIRIDSVRATEFVDVLIGNDQVNGFWGLAGADTINGGGGSDRMHYGEDYITGGTRGVLVNLAQGYGIDGFGDRDTLISIEEVYSTDANDTLIGDAADNRFFAYDGADSLSGEGGRDTLRGGAGHDTLYGGAGDDELWGDAGNDILNGGAGNDIARYLDATAGINANLATGLVADGEGGIDTLSEIEGIYGSAHADTIIGGAGGDFLAGVAGHDLINGAGGADTLLGGADNDTLNGGAGDDELWGGAGDDMLDGGEGRDLVRYRDALAAVSANLTTGLAQDGMGGTDRLSGIENLDGSTFGDLLVGDGQANRLFGFEGNDTLSGMAGADTILGGEGDDNLAGGEGDDELWGGAGNDTIDGGGGNDLVRYRGVEASVRADLVTGIAEDGQGGTDLLIGIEHLDGSDHADVLVGNGAANRLFGFAGADVIAGGAGNDVILGGTGDDSLMGDEGDDEIWGEEGADTIDGGAGIDLVRYRNATSGVVVRLAAGTAEDGTGSTDLLISIENAHGSDFADILIGDAGANLLQGFAGDDTLDGGTGADTLSGGQGADTYLFFAGGGRDVINDLGGAGDGPDRLIIADYLAENATVRAQGTSIILDFGVTSDSVTIANTQDAAASGAMEFIEFADGTIWDLATLLARVGQTGRPAVNNPATAGDDTLFGSPGDNVLSGGEGHDLIHGLAGNDTLYGGAGNDSILSGDGNDVVDGGDGDDMFWLGQGQDSVEGGDGFDTAVFDIAFAAIAGDFTVDADGVATISGNRLSGVELYSFADRDVTAAELAAMAGNAAPVSALPDVLQTPEGDIRVDLAAFFTDPEGDALSFEVTDLPDGIRLEGSLLLGVIAATGLARTITIIVSDGAHTERHIVDWQILNVNAAPSGSVTITGDAVIGQTLTLQSTVSDADGIDPASQSWVWLRNGVVIAGAGGTSYQLTDADFGAQITVRLQYTDLFGTAETVLSGPSAPVVAPALFLTGSEGADTLRGGLGQDTLLGLGGSDVLEGRDGNDELRGGDGSDTLIGGNGDDFLFGGDSTADLRDILYGGAGNDSLNGGYGNDELRGDAGNDTLLGDFGADMLIGGAGDDMLVGGPLGDELYGGAGNDTLNGGFGHDRMNGGTGADRFYHLGIADHGSDWIQDYNAAEGDVLVFGQSGATPAQFQINYAETLRAGVAGVPEVFVIYKPTGQILWALVDGGAQDHIYLQLGGRVYDLLA